MDFVNIILEKVITFGTAILMVFGVGNISADEEVSKPQGGASVFLSRIEGFWDLRLDQWFRELQKRKALFSQHVFGKQSSPLSLDKFGIETAQNSNNTYDNNDLPRVALRDDDGLKTEKANIEQGFSSSHNTEGRIPPPIKMADNEDEKLADPPMKPPSQLQKVFIAPKELNQRIRPATVNILCLTRYGGFFEPLTGSGVIIDPRGVILTNAHVAQYFLIEDYHVEDFVKCTIRTGSPARVSYNAEVLFLPETWLRKNAETITIANPKSTGEHDYALLRIVSASENKPLPEAFPAVRLSSSNEVVYRGAPVLIASYPAGFLGGIAAQKDLWLTTTISSIKEIYTFDDVPGYEIDVFEIFGTASAQEGTSGGAVVDLEKGEVAGIAVTRTEGETTGERFLRILSAFHIKKSFEKESGVSLETFLDGNLRERADTFASTTAPYLKEILYSVLDR